MIVPSKKLTWLELIMRIRGTVLPHIKYRLLFVVLNAVVVTIIEQLYLQGKELFSITPFSLIGLAVSIFLGFRNNTSYDRFWEGRKLWGGVVNTSRTLTRRIFTLIDDEVPQQDKNRLVGYCIGYVHSLRMHLRDEWSPKELQDYFTSDQLERYGTELNKPIAILHDLGLDLAQLYHKGHIHAQHLPVLEEGITDFTNLQGGCERIKSTPIPFSYNVLLHRIVAIYCFTLPFGLASVTGWFTPLVTALVGYAFLGIDAIGEEIEEPFGLDDNDLPLKGISRMIEINLRQRRGETELPALEKPDPISQVLN